MVALVDDSNIKLLLNWCAKMEQVAWQKNMKKKQELVYPIDSKQLEKLLAKYSKKTPSVIMALGIFM